MLDLLGVGGEGVAVNQMSKAQAETLIRQNTIAIKGKFYFAIWN